VESCRLVYAGKLEGAPRKRQLAFKWQPTFFAGVSGKVVRNQLLWMMSSGHGALEAIRRHGELL